MGIGFHINGKSKRMIHHAAHQPKRKREKNRSTQLPERHLAMLRQIYIYIYISKPLMALSG